MTSYAQFMSNLFGGRKVQKIAVDAGLSCPNRDGTIGTGGCTYCLPEAFSPPYCRNSASITRQIADGKRFFAIKGEADGFLAYFQSFTNTHTSINHLRELCEEALSVPDVVGIVIATRPDCIPEQTAEYLAEINQRTTTIVELGVETMHDRTLQLVNRCHNWNDSVKAINRLHERNILIGAHLILGLPEETVAHMEATVDAITQLPVTLLKMHQLQVMRGTRLAAQIETGELDCIRWSANEYAALCARLLRRIPPNIIVERWVAQAPAHLVVFPQWGLKPQQFQKLLQDEIIKLTK